MHIVAALWGGRRIIGEGLFVTRKLTAWLVGTALLLTVVVLVGCAVSTTVKPTAPKKHPEFTTGTSCSAVDCHATFKHEKPFTGECEKCHTTARWKPADYEHKDKSFDMGMHPLVGCTTCHTEGEELPSGGCRACHDAPHGGPKDCSSCHTTLAWTLREPLPKGHVSLAGGHSELDCFDCHTSNSFTPARQCLDCHADDNPHGRGITDCQTCHSPERGWKPRSDFDHDRFFPITGLHRRLDCTQCHTGGRFAGTPRICVGCHGRAHGGLTNCQACHTTSGFKPSTFRHSRVFALTGAHARISCSRCHPQRQFARVRGGGSTRCVSCHGSRHGGLTECQQCHTTSRFVPSTFRHSRVFPLTGEHASVACSSCHINGEFARVRGTTCVQCHAARSPHGPGITRCQDCHTPAGWAQTKPVTHPASNIPLGEEHAWPNPCSRCHPASNFTTPTRPCATCHTAPHVGPTGCLSCHLPTDWDDVRFTHPPIPNLFTGVGLSGHSADEFGPYPTGCAFCHRGAEPVTIPNFTTVSCTAAGCHQ